MKDCVLILGAPRTGSSCLSGCIYLCGVSLGGALSNVKDKHNEKGYFENEAILNFNRFLFQRLGIRWHDRDLTRVEELQLLEHRPVLLQILQNEFPQDLCGIKDFRLGIFSEIYLSAFNHLQTSLKIIVLKRNKQAVKASMRKMFGWESDDQADWMYKRCYRLFQRYYVHPHMELNFEDLVSNPSFVMSQVCKFIGINFDHKVVDFIEKGLVHESSD